MNIHTYDYWSEDKKLEASKLWADGLSASQIADRMGLVSRNTVIGIASRNRKLFPKREKTAPRSNVPQRQRKFKPYPMIERSNVPMLFKRRKVKEAFEIVARKPKPPTPPVESRAPYDAASLHKPLLDLQANECRWPVGHGNHGHLFCGHEASGPYCAHHKARSVGQGTYSERSAISEARRKA